MTEVFVGPKFEERQQYASPFIQRMLNREQDPAKINVRHKMRDFILKHHGPGKIRLMSLPGVGWDFEYLLYEAQPNVEFLALERNYSVLQQSLYRMPGGNVHEYHRRLKDRTIYIFKTDIARIAWLHSQDFVNIGRASLEGKQDRKQWRNEWRKWTAVLWDFTSHIGPTTLPTIRKTRHNLDMRKRTIPIIMSFLQCREKDPINRILKTIPGDAATKRVRFLEEWYNSDTHNADYADTRTLIIKDHLTYESQNRVPMLVVFGLLET